MADLVNAIRLRAPRGRWLAVDTDFYGPHFTLANAIGVPLDVVVRLYREHDNLREFFKPRGSALLHRPKQPLRTRTGDHVVWLLVDPSITEPATSPGDQIAPSTAGKSVSTRSLSALRKGWAYLSEDERRAIDSALAGSDYYGRNPPEGGWIDTESAEAPKPDVPLSSTKSDQGRKKFRRTMHKVADTPQVVPSNGVEWTADKENMERLYAQAVQVGAFAADLADKEKTQRIVAEALHVAEMAAKSAELAIKDAQLERRDVERERRGVELNRMEHELEEMATKLWYKEDEVYKLLDMQNRLLDDLCGIKDY